ncbi:MAG: helix-turn-helix domain-containing protein [Bacteroidota bacterium]
MVYDERLHELSKASHPLKVLRIEPRQSLQELVRGYYVLKATKSSAPLGQWYLLPDNSPYLIFYLLAKGDSIVPAWSLVGPRSRHKIIRRYNRLFSFICAFRPGGLRPLIDLPLSALRDQTIAVRELFPQEYEATFEQLTQYALQNELTAFVASLETFLLHSIKKDSRDTHFAIQAFCQYWQRPKPSPKIAVIAKDLGYSERQLRNLTQNHIGHSPKRISQIIRFTHSLQHYGAQAAWASIAYASGYYDQSHMIAEYHKMVGLSPERLFS